MDNDIYKCIYIIFFFFLNSIKKKLTFEEGNRQVFSKILLVYIWIHISENENLLTVLNVLGDEGVFGD